MIAQLNDIAQIWWQWMGSMFWQVSLFIILITALDMIIRKWAWPQVRYALWALVFIKLIITPAWQMPTSIVAWVQPQVEEQVTFKVEMSEMVEKDSVDFIAPVIAEQMNWESIALLAWISGVVVFTLMLIRKMCKFRKMHRVDEKASIPEWFNELIIKTATSLKLSKTPSVIFSEDAKSPAVYGVFRPVLLLPDGYINKLSGEQAEHVLMHELCHLKRGDLLVHWFCITVQIVYWFNPLLIWTRRQMRNVCEICCDLSVANILKEKTMSYRETLLHSARELFAENMQPSLGFFGIFEGPFRLVPRLKWLEKKTWENRKLKFSVTILTSLFMVACVMPMSKSSQKKETKEIKNATPEIKITKIADTENLNIEISDTDVTTVLMELNKFTEDNIIWDPSIKGRKISIVLKEIPLEEALDLVLKINDLEKRNAGENIIWITTSEKMKQIIEMEESKLKSQIKGSTDTAGTGVEKRVITLKHTDAQKTQGVFNIAYKECEFNVPNAFAEFKGNVIITHDSMVLSADSVKIFFKNNIDRMQEINTETIKTMVANGNVRIEYNKGVMSGENVIFDMDTKNIILNGASTFSKLGS